MRFLKLSSIEKFVTPVTIFALLLTTIFADFMLARHREPASAPTSAASKAPEHVDTPEVSTQVQQFRYEIQLDDELGFIAKASCGNASRAKEMASLNNIPNPNWIIAGKDVLSVLPQGCIAVFTPRRAVRANYARSATDSEKSSSDDEAHPAMTTSDDAIQWHAPAFRNYSWPTLTDFTKLDQATANSPENDGGKSVQVTNPAQTGTMVAPAQLTGNVPAPKGRVWYVVHLNSDGNRPMPIQGVWQALVVKNKELKSGAKYTLNYRTGVVAVPNGNGADVFVQLKHRPTEKDAILFLDGNGQRFRLRGQYMLENGNATEFAPAALPHVVPSDYVMVEKVFPVTESGFKKALKIGVPLAINTAIGFATGGPIGVVITDGMYEGMSFVHHKQAQAAERFAEAQQQ